MRPQVRSSGAALRDSKSQHLQENSDETDEGENVPFALVVNGLVDGEHLREGIDLMMMRRMMLMLLLLMVMMLMTVVTVKMAVTMVKMVMMMAMVMNKVVIKVLTTPYVLQIITTEHPSAAVKLHWGMTFGRTKNKGIVENGIRTIWIRFLVWPDGQKISLTVLCIIAFPALQSSTHQF